jgi:hypothetical protein
MLPQPQAGCIASVINQYSVQIEDRLIDPAETSKFLNELEDVMRALDGKENAMEVWREPFVDITLQMAPRYELGQGICKVLYESADRLYKELDTLNNSSFALGLDIAPSLDSNVSQLFSGTSG